MTADRRIRDEIAGRYVRWDGALWDWLLSGPGRRLSEALLAAGDAEAVAAATVEAWLRLAGEGIGCGYLVPEHAGARTVFTELWTVVLPEKLPNVPPERRGAVMADCWNLGENLETEALWLRRVVVHELTSLGALDDLRGFLARVGAAVDAPIRATLAGPVRVELVDLGVDDRRFLPGAVQFLSPRIVCVHDRLRPDTAPIGVWLREPVPGNSQGSHNMILGAMSAPRAPQAKHWNWRPHQRHDRRISELYADAHHPGFAVATLTTSQHLVIARPEPG